MADDKKKSGDLWSQLPKAEQERIRKDLLAKRLEVQPGAKTDRGTGFQLKGYVHCDLAKSDKEAFKQWRSGQPAEIGAIFLLRMADSGYLVKIGEGKDGMCATVSAADVRPEVNGYVLSAFASDADTAMTLLCYKHDVLMAQDWQPFMEPGGEDFLR